MTLLAPARAPDRLTLGLLGLGGLLVVLGVGLGAIGTVPLRMRADILYHTEPVGAIAGDQTVGQTFVAPYPGLYRVDLSLADYGRANTGPVLFRLLTAPGGEQLAARELRAESIRGDVREGLEFAPLADSAQRKYYVELAAPEATLDNCITAYIQPSAPYVGGEAYRAGQPIEGDLVFVLYFRTSAWERARILLDQIVAGRPGPWGSRVFIVGLVFAYLMAAGALVWSLRPKG